MLRKFLFVKLLSYILFNFYNKYFIGLYNVVIVCKIILGEGKNIICSVCEYDYKGYK